MTSYADVLPANPRQIKRIVNAVGMLDAVTEHLTGSLGDDLGRRDPLMRAAVMYVRFPELVSALLTDVEPPALAQEPWTRPDVRAVIGDVRIEDIAGCYGKTYHARLDVDVRDVVLNTPPDSDAAVTTSAAPVEQT